MQNKTNGNIYAAKIKKISFNDQDQTLITDILEEVDIISSYPDSS